MLLYDLHSALRWAGKGARIVSEPGRIPRSDPDPDLRRLVRLYDRRTAEGDKLCATAKSSVDIA